MLFGNKDTFGIEIRPVAPTWERRYAPEKTAWATLLVWIQGDNVCRLQPRGETSIQDGPNVPLAPLADWLVTSWHAIAYEERPRLFATSDDLHADLDRWGTFRPPASIGDDEWVDAREEWWSRHFLRSGADGAYLPFLALARQEESLILDWRSPNDPRREFDFLSTSGRGIARWQEAEAAVRAFVDEIAIWLEREGLVDLYPWIAKSDRLRAAERDGNRDLELFTGRSEEELRKLAPIASDDLWSALGVRAASPDPAASPVTQVLRDLPPNLSADAGQVLAQLLEAIREPSANAQESGMGRLRKVCADAQRGANTVEEAGYLCADALREEVGLNGKPVDDCDQLVRFLGIGIHQSDVPLARTEMVAGGLSTGASAAVLLPSKRMSAEWARRFEVTRALGHLAMDDARGGAVGCASSSFAKSWRRRRSGAFAAEFLLPRRALAEITGGLLDQAADAAVFREIMKTYGVGAKTTAQHLWNHGLLSSSELRDDLIETYAAV